MQRIIDCLIYEHDYRLTFAAVFVCIMGSWLTARLFMRTRSISNDRMAIQLGLTGIIGGTTAWATHFLSMLAYDPGIPHAYDFVRTALSLAVAIFGVSLALAVSKMGKGLVVITASGTLFGITIAAMHYVGMWAYLVVGTVEYEASYVSISILGGIIGGCLMIHRLAYPVTRYCWVGAAAAMVLTICVVHFISMGSMTIVPNPTISVPEQLVSEAVMAAIILAVVIVLISLGFGSFLIEVKLVAETKSLIRSASLHDPLTKLPNRTYLQSYLQDMTDETDRNGKDGFVVFTIDIDRFRAVNTQFGNGAGDIVLKEVADRLSDCIKPGDFLGRTDSDEFVIVRRGLFMEEATHEMALAWLKCFDEPIDLASGPLTISASVGSARFPGDAMIPHDLLQKSQYAMKQAKISLGAPICYYDAEMDEKSRAHDALIADLRKALVNNEFFLNFQKQNDIHTHSVVGFEVLCRWRHPERGLVPPSIFIPIAEEIGVIGNLGIWVLREACHEAVQWKIPYRIAVNVAPPQLSQPDFVSLVQDILATTGLSPSRLELEITEASLIDDHTDALNVMQKLKAMGIAIAMDDFGTGYSSLATLQAFPFDKIKIDRSFVHDVHMNMQRSAIVRSTLLLGAALDIPVLAEGIEKLEELAFLQKENCHEAQGFFFGTPMDVAAVREITGLRDCLQKAG